MYMKFCVDVIWFEILRIKPVISRRIHYYVAESLIYCHGLRSDSHRYGNVIRGPKRD